MTVISELSVRRAAYINESPDVVWREFETRERLAAWFGTGHTLEIYEPQLHGRVELSVEIDGEKRGFGGNIIVFEPHRELTFTDNWYGEMAWPVPMLITIRLAPLYAGTLVELFHHGFEQLGANAGAEYESYEAGWDNHHLVALRQIVES